MNIFEIVQREIESSTVIQLFLQVGRNSATEESVLNIFDLFFVTRYEFMGPQSYDKSYDKVVVI